MHPVTDLGFKRCFERGFELLVHGDGDLHGMTSVVQALAQSQLRVRAEPS
jgi:hypothetical protein